MPLTPLITMATGLNLSNHNQRSHHTRSSTLYSTRSSGESNQQKSALHIQVATTLLAATTVGGGTEILYQSSKQTSGVWGVFARISRSFTHRSRTHKLTTTISHSSPAASIFKSMFSSFKIPPATSATQQPPAVGNRLLNLTHTHHNGDQEGRISHPQL